MVRTRAQERAEAAPDQKPAKVEERVSPKHAAEKKKQVKKPKERVEKQEIPKPVAKPAEHKPPSGAVRNEIHQLVNEQGSLPLQGIGLEFPLASRSATLLALLLEALLKAAPISHKNADQTLKGLLKHDYHDINVLKRTTWDERSDLLHEVGYQRYNQRVATELGGMVEWLMDKYDGDLDNLYKQTSGSRSKIRSALKQIKGIGDLGVDIFLSSVQPLWPEVAPFIPERSLVTAEHIGIGTDMDVLFDEVGRDPKQMCMLSRALTKIRLEKEEKEYTVHEEEV
ncbi:hypothetical protein PRK78_003159 [Emydomyces testavorans]|uniref:Endonuclease n=1 Tax=Emydomyces testavorans TaxID=2070801 RepID=A0AAF0DFP3_9EURO|nr:hypothetical protein PRK78_003159 [Emydomyces testavorans]